MKSHRLNTLAKRVAEMLEASIGDVEIDLPDDVQDPAIHEKVAMVLTAATDLVRPGIDSKVLQGWVRLVTDPPRKEGSVFGLESAREGLGEPEHFETMCPCMSRIYMTDETLLGSRRPQRIEDLVHAVKLLLNPSAYLFDKTDGLRPFLPSSLGFDQPDALHGTLSLLLPEVNTMSHREMMEVFCVVYIAQTSRMNGDRPRQLLARTIGDRYHALLRKWSEAECKPQYRARYE